MTKGAQCKTLIGCIHNTNNIFYKVTVTACKDCEEGQAFISTVIFPVMPHSARVSLHQPVPVQMISSLDVWQGSPSAALRMVGSTYCSVSNHKSS